MAEDSNPPEQKVDPKGEPIRVEIREVTYTCPKRGKVTEKIEVKIYDTGGKPVVQVCR